MPRVDWNLQEVEVADLFGDDVNPEEVLARADPDARNREGDVVFRGQGPCHNKYYCGILKGKKLIRGSDGRCGPTNGPQCDACRIYQEEHPIENEFAHLARNADDLLRIAGDPEAQRAEGIANARRFEVMRIP